MIPTRNIATLSLLSLFSAGVILHTVMAEAVSAAEPAAPQQIKRYIAIDNVCAWPQLAVLRDGTIAAILHNQPAHGLREGDVECWTSANGEFWSKVGTPAPHEPNTIRMNHAAGLAKNGDLLVLCAGWTNEQQPGQPKKSPFRDAILRSWVCRSSDGGRTWTQNKEFVAPEKGAGEFVPFGPISPGDDGALHASCYGGRRAWHFLSDDDGKTWRPTAVIAMGYNETSIFHLGGKRWLAAARLKSADLFRSDDDGATWQGPQPVTEPDQINAHLARLKDGRLLLSYGNRVKGQFGVMAKLSSDEGKSWSEPLRLAHTLSSDCGYPSSVQRPDGKIVTVYYARSAENHNRYHMGVAIWEAPALNSPQASPHSGVHP
ncbi:MAG: exo-alpha-sialidase [Verrucomicrobia bacterium]|nr:exo-alpha-sialidase [Verrucomicrobiota bacterium]